MFFVYILASKYKRLYIGVTNDIDRRLYEHKHKLVEGFTSKYNIDRLVYYETFDSASMAIERETRLKGLLREKKIALIEGMNPEWKDLSEAWTGTSHMGDVQIDASYKTSGDSSLRSE